MPMAPIIATQLTTPATRVISVFIGSRDVTGYAKWDSLVATDNGSSGRSVTNLHLKDVGLGDLPEVEDRSLLRVMDHATDTELGRGIVVSRMPSSQPGYSGVDIAANDIGSVLDDVFIRYEPRPAETMRQRIGFLWGKHAGAFLSGDLSNVVSIGSTLAAQTFTGVTLRQAIEMTISQASTDAAYYTDALGKLHVLTSETNAAPVIIVGSEPQTGEDAPESLSIDYEANSYANRVHVQGATPAASSFYQNDGEIARKGYVVTATIQAPDCKTASMAEALGRMYLGRVAGVTRGSFTLTGTDGWRSGQKLVVRDVAAGLTETVVAVASTSTVSSGGTLDWHGRASIKRRPSDNALVLVYRRGSHHAINDGALYIRFSNDDGATWTAENTTLGGAAVTGFPMNPSTLSAGEDAGEPWLYVAPNGDLLLHMWRVDYGVTANGTYQSRSTDGGHTWSASAAVTISGVANSLLAFATDDDFVLDSVIYAGARVYADVAPSNVHAILIKSTDNGTTWSKVSDITEVGSFTNEVGFEYVGTNTIVAVIRSLLNDHTYLRRSTDLGLTWGALEDVSNSIGISGRHRIYTRAHLKGLANWWNDPVLVMVGFHLMTPNSSQQRRNCVWFSPDRGEHWSGPHYLAAQTEDAGYSDMFYAAGSAQYGIVAYQGTLATADLVQYRITMEAGEPFRIFRVTSRIARPGAGMVRSYGVEFGGSRMRS